MEAAARHVISACDGDAHAAELALVLRVPLPSLLPWSIVSITGAATVLSFAVIADYFPNEYAARANGTLNLLHFGWAFAVQYGIGLVVGQWPSQDGHYPIAAYQTAFGLSIALQLAALVWFAIPWIQMLGQNLWQPSAQLKVHDMVGSSEASNEWPILEACEGVEW